jgi:hypothetical protein
LAAVDEPTRAEAALSVSPAAGQQSSWTVQQYAFFRQQLGSAFDWPRPPSVAANNANEDAMVVYAANMVILSK